MAMQTKEQRQELDQYHRLVEMRDRAAEMVRYFNATPALRHGESHMDDIVDHAEAVRDKLTAAVAEWDAADAAAETREAA